MGIQLGWMYLGLRGNPSFPQHRIAWFVWTVDQTDIFVNKATISILIQIETYINKTWTIGIMRYTALNYNCKLQLERVVTLQSGRLIVTQGSCLISYVTSHDSSP